jgi:hypothetical protein
MLLRATSGYALLSAAIACGAAGTGAELPRESGYVLDAGRDSGLGDVLDASHSSEAGSSVPSTDSSISERSTVVHDASVDAVDVSPPLCDGSNDIRFYAAAKATGQRFPGSQVRSENGDFYIIVDGSCRFWSYDGGATGGGQLASGQLSDADAEEFAQDFRLADWSKWIGQHDGSSCSDGTDYVFSLSGAGTLRGKQWCPPPAEFSWAYTAFHGTRGRLSKVGAQVVDGAMRFVLVHEAPERVPSSAAYRNAPLWPLVEPATVALTEASASAYVDGTARLAVGSEATKLRSLRDAFLAQEIGFIDSDFIGVVDGAADEYRLYVRDATALENGDGLLPIAW